MKILLISPTIDAEKRTNKGLMLPQLSLYILQGLTPPEHEVKLIEEEVDDIDLEERSHAGAGVRAFTYTYARA